MYVQQSHKQLRCRDLNQGPHPGASRPVLPVQLAFLRKLDICKDPGVFIDSQSQKDRKQCRCAIPYFHASVILLLPAAFTHLYLLPLFGDMMKKNFLIKHRTCNRSVKPLDKYFSSRMFIASVLMFLNYHTLSLQAGTASFVEQQ